MRFLERPVPTSASRWQRGSPARPEAAGASPAHRRNAALVAKGTTCSEGESRRSKIGVIGFTTGIMNWDKRYLEGKVYHREGAVESATVVPELRARAPTSMVALLHSGLDSAALLGHHGEPGLVPVSGGGHRLSMVMGHQHWRVPDTAATPSFNLAGAWTHKAGTVNGDAAVIMANSWGNGAWAVVQLALRWDGSKWVVNKSASRSELRNIQSKNAAGATVTVDADPAIARLSRDTAPGRHPVREDTDRPDRLSARARCLPAWAARRDQIVNQAQQGLCGGLHQGQPAAVRCSCPCCR